MDWQIAREIGWKWYGKVAHFFLFQNIVMYTFACVAAHSAIGLTRYIAFLDHCCHFMR